ncbi:MAG: Bax inhibitor-1/YccA family protein [Ruminococcus sp.]|nr:Bax inhibitor-1/YccA family protein [Ruminococcus sp.]
MNNTVQNKKQNKSFFRSNPVMNRLNKIDEVAGNEKAAGYGRITVKTAYFLLVTLGGMMLYLVLNSTLFASQAQTLHMNYRGFEVSTSAMQVAFAAGAGILAIITQLVAAFARNTIPVSGTIYSLCQGFILSFTIFTLIKGYEYLGLLALGITVIVVLCMAILYSTGTIRVTQKFRMVMFTLFMSMVGISLLSFVGFLIPFTRPFVSMIMGNFWVSIGLTILSILIACLFLISDFATIDNVVENKMPAKYEWMAAFGLAFTVIWIYVKILDLLIQIVGNSKK